ncbi:MAG: hypothetical protein WC134_02780 [Acholeplasmataceae bacterium]|jgi:hypothetical protein|nr:hypothetical protein [Acholeplasmataceae bacterium]
MKLTITGYFDLNPSLDDTIEILKRNQLSHVILRAYNHRPLLEMNDQDIRELQSKLKNKKIEIAMLDTMIEPYPIESKKKQKEALDEFIYFIKLSSKLKVDYLLMELPVFHDCIKEIKSIEKVLEPFIEQALINRKTIVIKPSKDYRANVYAYLIKKMKTEALKLAFNPVMVMNQNESETTAYRLLKKHMVVFMAKDQDRINEPQLLGYGKTDMLNLFKRLIRDRYNGFVFADHDFSEKDLVFDPEKIGFFKRIFGKEKKRKEAYLQTLQKRLFPNEPDKKISIDDITDNQINVLKVVFK